MAKLTNKQQTQKLVADMARYQGGGIKFVKSQQYRRDVDALGKALQALTATGFDLDDGSIQELASSSWSRGIWPRIYRVRGGRKVASELFDAMCQVMNHESVTVAFMKGR